MHRDNHHARTDLGAYVEHGLGPLPAPVNARELYIDVVKRAVANILYQDESVFYQDSRGELVLADGFNLRSRVLGEDFPTSAHTMIGIKRLDNLKECIESVLRDGVHGDIIEAGVMRGGAAIFARAVLKAHGIVDRRVIACDTFQPKSRRPASRVIAGEILKALSYVPGTGWKKRVFLWLQSLDRAKNKDLPRSFPPAEDPSDEIIKYSIFAVRNIKKLDNVMGASLEDVMVNFARYGLLDDQVVFLRGFFSETLRNGSIGELAVMRLDGDTYESTMDALSLLYPKLSVGGYCVIDDFHRFPDCKRAVEEYRSKNSIEDEIVTIDRQSAYWKKTVVS